MALFSGADTAPRLRPLETAEEALRDTDTDIVVLVSTPADFLEQAFAQGQEPGDALRAWKQQTEDFLTAFRKARHRIIALNQDLITAQPEVVTAILNKRLKLALAPSSTTVQPDTPSTQPEMRTIAHLLIDSDDKARRLADELEASVLHAPTPHRPDSAEIAQLYQAVTLAQNKEARHQEETDILLQNQRSILNELEKEQARTAQTAQNAAQSSADYTGLRTDVSHLRKDLDQARLDLKMMTTERDQLRREIARAAQTQALRESALGAQLLEDATELAKVCGQRDQAERQLEAVYQSRSWRVTKPMRTLRGGRT